MLSENSNTVLPVAAEPMMYGLVLVLGDAGLVEVNVGGANVVPLATACGGATTTEVSRPLPRPTVAISAATRLRGEE